MVGGLWWYVIWWFSASDLKVLALARGPKYPVVILPGIAASVLDGKLNRTETAEWYCTKKADWRVIYFSFREALSPLCLCDELKVLYDEPNNKFLGQPGVQIRPHDFGGLKGITSLDPSQAKLTATYLPLVKGLEAVGYVERATLWGAPYDWRFAADGLATQGVADEMQALIEMAVSTAGGKPAVIIAHSMGNLVLAYFLKLWGPAWARKHIHHVVAASGPWAGSVKSIKGTVSGDNFGLPIPHNLLHSLQGVAPSGPWLFPAEDVWPPDAIIVRTNVKHYTAADLGSLLQDIGSTDLAAAWPKLRQTHSGQLDEGNGLDTDESYIYSVAHLDTSTAPEPYKVQSKDGDGTVNSRSLQACGKVGFANQTTMLELPLESHLSVLSARPFLHQLAKILEVPGIDLIKGAQAVDHERLVRAPVSGVVKKMNAATSAVQVVESN